MLMGYVLKINPIYSANLEITGSIRLIVSALATPMILQGANLSAIRNTFNTLLKPFVTGNNIVPATSKKVAAIKSKYVLSIIFRFV